LLPLGHDATQSVQYYTMFCRSHVLHIILPKVKNPKLKSFCGNFK